MDAERDTEKTPCDDEGRDWTDASTSQAETRIVSKHQKLGRDVERPSAGTLLTPWFRLSSFLVFCETIHFYGFKLLCLSVQFSRSVVPYSLWPHGLQHARPPVHHHILEFAQTHVHRVGDAIQPSHLLSSPSPPAFNLSQSEGLSQWLFMVLS